MALGDFVDLYCERTGPGFWAEPVNALTNLAYVVGAALAWRAVRRSAASPPASLQWLPPALAAVGVFSFLFHTLATMWAAIADQLVILLFGCLFLYAFIRHVAGGAAPPALVVAVLFGVVSYLTPRLLPPGWLNRSGGYLPYLLGLLAMAGWLGVRRHAGAPAFGGAIGLFCLALALRTADQAWCSNFPLGTHFLWHLLTGAMLTLLTLTILRARAQAR